MTATRALVACLVLAAATTATTAVPSYSTCQMQLRSNIVDGYNLPANSSFIGVTPAVDAAGRVAMSLASIASDPSQVGLWRGEGDGTGSIVWQGADVDAVAGDPTFDGSGNVYFPINGSATLTSGVWRHEATLASTAVFTTLPLGASYWTALGATSTGVVGYQADFSSGRAWVSYDGAAAAIHVIDSGLGASPYVYLYSPSFNEQRLIAGKVSVATYDEHQIRVFDAAGASTLIAENDDLDPASPYASFRNSVCLADDGRVAFVAALVAGGDGVYLSDGTTTVEIATTADAAVSDIAYFAPSANALGQVAFRGDDGSGLQAIFVGDGDELVRVVGEHDLLPTDLGEARVDQNSPSDPVFGGAPAIGADGRVVFVATLTPPDDDQVEWGTGVFVALPGIFVDGFESGDTTSWSGVEPPVPM